MSGIDFIYVVMLFGCKCQFFDVNDCCNLTSLAICKKVKLRILFIEQNVVVDSSLLVVTH